jgi:hypothetical protein
MENTALAVPTPTDITDLVTHGHALMRTTTGMVEVPVLVSAEQSRDCTEFLQLVQHKRRAIVSYFTAEKQPFIDRQRDLRNTERVLVEPLKGIEKVLSDAVLAFEASQEPVATLEALEALGETPAVVPEPTRIAGTKQVTTWGATVTNLEALILAVAGQILLSEEKNLKMTKVTRKWLTTHCQPTTQATISLLRENPSALTALAKAMKEFLRVPGLTSSKKPTLYHNNS